MELFTLLMLCKRYSELGSAIQEQLRAVESGKRLEEQNQEALELVEDFLTDATCFNVDGARALRNKVSDYLRERRRQAQ